PFTSTDGKALLHQVLHEEPAPLRSHDPAVPAELETIVLKAMAKAPEDRYATAGELAEDLRRFLAGEPIKARRATLWQRGWRWLARNPSLVVSAVVVLALTAVGSLLAAWLIAQEQGKTELAYKAEQGQRREAERQAKVAEER